MPDGIQFELLRAFSLTREQEARMASAFYQAKAAAYRDELVTLANRFGLDRRRAILSPQIREALRSEARSHAQSVVRTYNRLMVSEINRLSARALTADEMVSSLAEFMRARGAVRSPMISKIEVATARLDARAAFYRENGVEPELDFKGPPPKCPVCQELIATNPHSLERSIAVGYPHLNCVVEGTRVLPLGVAETGYRALYQGPVVRIAAKTGEWLTVTPNHPVATGRGWIAAKALREGDDLLRCHPLDWPGAFGRSADTDFDHMPAAEDMFEALEHVGAGERRAATGHDFHGDGIAAQGEVHVVGAYGLLLNKADPKRVEIIGEAALVGADVGPESLPRRRLAAALLHRYPTPTSGVVSRLNVGPVHHPPAFLVEPSPQGLVADAQFRRECGDAFAVEMTPVKLAEVRYVDTWRGHVFDFQTESMAYVADGLLIHNCTHSWISRPITAEQLREGGIRPGQISVGRGEIAGIVGSPTWLERGGAGSQEQARDNLALLG